MRPKEVIMFLIAIFLLVLFVILPLVYMLGEDKYVDQSTPFVNLTRHQVSFDMDGRVHNVHKAHDIIYRHEPSATIKTLFMHGQRVLLIVTTPREIPDHYLVNSGLVSRTSVGDIKRMVHGEPYTYVDPL